MDCNRDEALRAMGIAEEKMAKNDFEGARRIALKAKQQFPELDNISQLIAVCDIHCVAQNKVNDTEMDLYEILQLENIANEATIRRQYHKLALVLHPDKNKFPGAEAAFRLVNEAYTILSEKWKRMFYNCQENQSSYAQDKFKTQFNGVNFGRPQPSNPNVQSTFSAFCPFCNKKYQYNSEHVNKPLPCPHCKIISYCS